jgi:stearoyl-CoA desaturase (delta-9 desaturase)
VRQLAAKQTAADITTLPLLVEPESVPLYKLGYVAKRLHDIVVCLDGKDKLQVDLSPSEGSIKDSSFLGFLSTIYAPFRTFANNLLLWESRDFALYFVAAIYFAAVYVGSDYFPEKRLYLPFCVFLPFFGPKSKAARYLRSLQEDVRLAQGRAAEKKGGMDVDGVQLNGYTINLPMVVYLGGSHVTAVYALFVLLFFGGVCPLFGNGAVVKSETLIMAFALYICSGWGITAGAHRLWAHRSYQASKPLRVVLMIFNSIANQGTIYHWARDHRLHHKYSDTVADPHDANRGFFFSHCGWLITKKNPAVLKCGRDVNITDLKQDSLVMFQKKVDPFWNLLWCFAFPAFLAVALGDSFWNGFMYGGALRYCMVLNATWAVNSVVHCIGNRPYNPSHLTTENGWVSLFALGEGWHNWHHAFAWDYATAEAGALCQFNPTKIFIDVMAFLGLAWDRKRADKVWENRKARWVKEQGRPVIESWEGPPLFKHRVITFGPKLEDDHVNIVGDVKSVEQ